MTVVHQDQVSILILQIVSPISFHSSTSSTFHMANSKNTIQGSKGNLDHCAESRQLSALGMSLLSLLLFMVLCSPSCILNGYNVGNDSGLASKLYGVGVNSFEKSDSSGILVLGSKDIP